MGLVLAYNKANAQPSFTVGAAITGTAEVGQTLTCTYTVLRAKTVSITWHTYTDDDPESGETQVGSGPIYQPVGADVGKFIRAKVYAFNNAGWVQSDSALTAAVASAEPPAPPSIVTPAQITGTLDVSETVSVTYDFDGETSVEISWTSYDNAEKANPQPLGTGSEVTLAEGGKYIGVNVRAINSVGYTDSEDIQPMVGVDAWAPALPAEYAVPAYDLTGMTPVYCNAGDDLQAKINSLVPGEYLVVEAGATWTGNFYFPNTNANGTDWIYVISSAMASLPAEGTRVTSDDAANMPKIQAGSRTSTAMGVYRGTKRVRFVGIEFTTTYAATDNVQYTIVPIGYFDDAGSGSIDEVIFDRCYIHGTDTGNNRDGIVTYAVTQQFAVVECEVSNFASPNYESHALHMYQGQGPFTIRNNKFEAAAIPVFIGDNFSFGTPKDITFVGNLCTKRTSWHPSDPSYDGIARVHKNIFEIKYGQRIRIEGNIFENSFNFGTPGGLIITAIGDVVTDVTIKNNIIRNVQLGTAILLSATGSFAVPASALDRCLVANNLLYNLGNASAGTANSTIGITGSGSKRTRWARILHNTASHVSVRPPSSAWMSLNQTTSSGASGENIDIRDNCYTAGKNHIITNGVAGDTAGLNIRLTGEWYYRHNMAIEAEWPYSTWFDDNNANVYGHINVSSRTNAKFADVSLADPSDFVLAADSPGHAAGTDGEDVGCDIPALLAAIAAVNDTTP